MRQLFYAAGLMLAAAAPVRAQDVCTQYRPTPGVGGWAEYVNTRGDQSSTMRLAIVGQEKRNGKDAVWFESAGDSPRGKMVVELLVPGFPFEQGDVMEMVIKRGDDPAMKMPAAMLGGGRGGPGRGRPGNAASSWETQCKSMTVVGPESVTVPAGTFKTTHLRDSADSTDVWVNKDIPFGFVKSVSRGGTTMMLKASGKNARKTITETPQEMTGMPGS